MKSIGTITVGEVMITKVVTVMETDKMEAVAKRFEERNIHAAPVVDQNGRCVGIITSHDIVEYEAIQKEVFHELNYGFHYNMASYGSGMDVCLPGKNFDEIGCHMTRTVDSAVVDDPLSRVARQMCTHHRHHVLVLDDQQKPVGILSSLDVLGFVIGEQVGRSSHRVRKREHQEDS